jgi:dihydroflavonol-4-reductase
MAAGMSDPWRGRAVFVTGASGLLGYAIARTLLERGASVRALCRGPSLPGELAAMGVTVVQGDLDDRAALRRGLAGATHAFHVAADVRMWRGVWAEVLRTNVEGTRNVVEAALEAGGARLIFTSSAATLGRPLDATHGQPVPIDERNTYDLGALGMIYPHTKWLAEQEVSRGRARGLWAVITHPAAVFGPWDWKRNALPAFTATRGLGGFAIPGGYRTVCDVRDVADGHLAAAERGVDGEHYAFGGHPMPLVDLFAMMAREVGGHPPRLTLPAGATRALGRMADALALLRGKAPLFTEEMALQATLRVAVRSDKAARELGYRSRPPEETIRDAVAWYRAQGALG